MFRIILVLIAMTIPAKADECSNPLEKFIEAVTSADPDHNKVAPLSKDERDAIILRYGPPPVEGDFEFSIGTTADFGMVLIIQNSCIVGKIGPLPIQMINSILGRQTI